MIVYEVFYNNGYKYPDYTVHCEGGYPTYQEAKNHQQWYASNYFDRIDKVEYDEGGMVVMRQKGYKEEEE